MVLESLEALGKRRDSQVTSPPHSRNQADAAQRFLRLLPKTMSAKRKSGADEGWEQLYIVVERAVQSLVVPPISLSLVKGFDSIPAIAAADRLFRAQAMRLRCKDQAYFGICPTSKGHWSLAVYELSMLERTLVAAPWEKIDVMLETAHAIRLEFEELQNFCQAQEQRRKARTRRKARISARTKRANAHSIHCSTNDSKTPSSACTSTSSYISESPLLRSLSPADISGTCALSPRLLPSPATSSVSPPFRPSSSSSPRTSCLESQDVDATDANDADAKNDNENDTVDNGEDGDDDDDDDGDYDDGARRSSESEVLCADSFFPIWLYVLVNTPLHRPYAWLHYINLLAGGEDGNRNNGAAKCLSGEAGYYLTMFEAGLEYISHFSGDNDESNESESNCRQSPDTLHN